MADLLSFDTTFLIDLQKERLANRKGGANQFLQRHQGSFDGAQLRRARRIRGGR